MIKLMEEMQKALEPLIVTLSESFKIDGYGADDLRQECNIKVFIVLRDMEFSSFEDAKYFCISAIKNNLKDLLRISKAKKRNVKLGRKLPTYGHSFPSFKQFPIEKRITSLAFGGFTLNQMPEFFKDMFPSRTDTEIKIFIKNRTKNTILPLINSIRGQEISKVLKLKESN